MSSEIQANLTNSLVFFLLWLFCKMCIQKFIEKWKFKMPENRLRRSVQIQNFMFFALAFGFMIIWATALKNFALSVVVIASAIAISFKEYIMCFLGGILKAGSDYFLIGDRIRVGDFRGDVINQNPFTTTLFEVGPGDIYHNYTGKKIILPNSLFLTTPVINESYGSKYVLHTFSIFLERTCDWRTFKKILEKSSHTVCSGFLDKAQSYFNTMAKKSGLEPPVATPTVTVGMSHLYSVELVVRIAAPFKQKGDLEQKILAMTFDEELDLQARVK